MWCLQGTGICINQVLVYAIIIFLVSAIAGAIIAIVAKYTSVSQKEGEEDQTQQELAKEVFVGQRMVMEGPHPAIFIVDHIKDKYDEEEEEQRKIKDKYDEEEEEQQRIVYGKIFVTFPPGTEIAEIEPLGDDSSDDFLIRYLTTEGIGFEYLDHDDFNFPDDNNFEFDKWHYTGMFFAGVNRRKPTIK